MANSYYSPTTIVAQTKARSSQENAERTAVEVAFDRMPTKASMDAGSVWFVTDTGAADVYAVAMQKTATSYTDGMSFTMKVANTNTGACTVNVDSLGAKAVKLANGTDPIAGDLTDGDLVDMRYDADAGYFRITSVSRSIINGQASMSDAEIKTAYENNADTNAFTDAEQTKLGYISVTEAIDLDELGAIYLTGSGSGSAGQSLAVNTNGTVSVVAANNGTDTIGTAATFAEPTEAGERAGKNLVKISDGKVLWVGSDDSDAGNRGECLVITYDPDNVAGTITANTAVSYEAGEAKVVAACLISENKVLAVYADAGNSEYATAVVIRVDGLVPVPGTPVVFKSAAVSTAAFKLDCCAIDTDKAVVYSSTAGATELFICTVSGLTPSFGSAAAIDSNAASVASICKLARDQFFVAYQDTGDSNYLNGVVGSANGTTVALKTPARIYAGTASSFVSAQFLGLKSGKYAVVACSDAHAHLVMVDGSAFTVSTSTAITSSGDSASLIGDTLGVLYSTFNGTVTIGVYDVDIDAETITSVDTVTIGSSPASYYGSILGVGERLFMAQWERSSAGYVNLAAVRQSNRARFVGFASNGFTDTQSVTVNGTGSVNTNQSGLTAGTRYWLKWDGTLTTKKTSVYAGIALSATELLVGGARST